MRASGTISRLIIIRLRGIFDFNRHFNVQHLVRWLLLGGAVGVTVGFAAILFQFLLQSLTQLSFETIIGLPVGGPLNEEVAGNFPAASRYSPWLLVLMPAIGGLLTAFIVLKFAPEARGHGTDAAIDAYHRRQGKIRPRVPIVKMISSVITIGTGGSGGREGPIAQIGAGVGSMLANVLKLDVRTRQLLLASGLAAGVGAIFRAPLAAAIFATEVLYSGVELESEALLPSAVASIVSYSVFGLWYGFEPIFGQVGDFRFSTPLELFPYLILALVVGLGALMYVNAFHGIGKLFSKLPLSPYSKPAIGGLLTGLIGWGMYTATRDANSLAVMGSGYGVLQQILTTDAIHLSVGLLLLISLGKMLTTSLTIGSGGSAGVFGPSMVIGGTLGAAVGSVAQTWLPALNLHPGAFMIVGMAGFFSAAANAPLSTLIMVSELTGNYELLIPSMWVCTIAYLVCRRWTLYTSQVRSRLDSPAHIGECASEILSIATVSAVYKKTRKFVRIPADAPLLSVLPLVEPTSQRIFPVVGGEGNLLGAFRLADLNIAIEQPRAEIADRKARDIVAAKTQAVLLSDTIQDALAIMTATHAEELIVCDDANPSKIAGIITRADILLYYSRQISKLKIGQDQHQPLPAGLDADDI